MKEFLPFDSKRGYTTVRKIFRGNTEKEGRDIRENEGAE